MTNNKIVCYNKVYQINKYQLLVLIKKRKKEEKKMTTIKKEMKKYYDNCSSDYEIVESGFTSGNMFELLKLNNVEEPTCIFYGSFADCFNYKYEIIMSRLNNGKGVN